MSVKTYNYKVANGRYWYVHISRYYGLPDIYHLYRGDSDPMLLYQGCLYDENDVWSSLYNYFEEIKNDDPELFPYKDADDWIKEYPENIYGELCKVGFNQRLATKPTTKSKPMELSRPMTDSEQQVMLLSTQLKDLTEIATSYAPYVVQEDWDAHHCAMVTLSDTIGDWQVFRVFDVEIDWCDPVDKANQSERIRLEEAEQYDQEHKHSNLYDEIYDEIVERICSEGDSPYNEFEVYECNQFWLNVHTGEEIMLGKIFEERPRFYDETRTDWDVVDLESDNKVYQDYRTTFYHRFGSHYKDVNLHPIYAARGYDGMDAAEWYYGCGEEEYRSKEAKFFRTMKQENLLEWFYDLAQGNEWERRFKQYGMDAVIESGEIDMDSEAYFTAVKIANRNGYDYRKDLILWQDMVKALFYLDKDLHNSHYVCPANLKEAHDRWMKLYERKKKERAKRIKELEALGKEHAYAGLHGKFLDCRIETEKFNIFVCPTVADMVEEGQKMHHCVGSMGYEKKATSLILFVRDKWDARISTVELDNRSWTIIQNRGMCNSEPCFNGQPCVDELNKLIINKFVPVLKAAKHRKPAKIVELKPNHATTSTIAVAA